jgi:protein TonB
MHYPDRAYTKGVEGVVIVEFSIDTNGIVSDIKAIGGPSYGGLRDEAIRLIKISGKWVPAYQWENNIKTFVKSQKRQPFVFKIGG